MALSDLAALSKLAESLFTINKTLANLEKGLESINKEISGLRTDISGLTTRVAVLEESRKTVDAQMKLAVTEAVSDLRVRFAEAKADLRVKEYQTAPPPALPSPEPANSDKAHSDSDN